MEEQGGPHDGPGRVLGSAVAPGEVTTLARVIAETQEFVGHPAHVGTYRGKIEPNGRLVLPSALKGPFVDAGNAIVRTRRSDYVELYAPKAFELTVRTLVERQPDQLVSRRARIAAYNRAHRAAVDSQSRLVIPAEMREKVGLGEEIVFRGSIDCVEIWPAARHDAQGEDDDLLDLLLDDHLGLDLEP